MQKLFPPITPYHQFELPVTPPHMLYVEECGNPDGLPVIFIHGGPGVGCSEADRQFFDPKKYRIILFDQRGSGRSKPLACLENNTTNDLISDIELIRKTLKIDKWVVFGGSWGSTLSLLYTQAHPEPAIALILRGIFLATKAEFAHLFQSGMSKVFPQEFERFKNFIAPDKQDDLLTAYCDLITGPDRDIARKAAYYYVEWEANGVTLAPQSGLVDPDSETDIANGIIECTYLANQCFIEEGQILENMDKIAHIPMYIAHGRFDSIVTPHNAWKLFKAHPNAVLKITDNAAHASRETTTASELVGYTNLVADMLLNT